MLPVYESANIDASWGVGSAAVDLTKGWADNTFLTVVQIGPMLDTSFGADGQMGVSKMAAKGGTISLTLKQTAPLNKELARIAKLQMARGAPVVAAPFKVIDKTAGSAHFVALNAVLSAQADHEFADVMGEKTWVWTCESFIAADDPVTLVASVTDWIRG
jgi:hypothetical protein